MNEVIEAASCPLVHSFCFGVGYPTFWSFSVITCLQKMMKSDDVPSLEGRWIRCFGVSASIVPTAGHSVGAGGDCTAATATATHSTAKTSVKRSAAFSTSVVAVAVVTVRRISFVVFTRIGILIVVSVIVLVTSRVPSAVGVIIVHRSTAASEIAVGRSPSTAVASEEPVAIHTATTHTTTAAVVAVVVVLVVVAHSASVTRILVGLLITGGLSVFIFLNRDFGCFR